MSASLVGSEMCIRDRSSSARLHSMALSVFTCACRLVQDSGPGRQVGAFLCAEQSSELWNAPAIRLSAESHG
eukprot:6405743-Alexandrium_andersonii.AAC.1